MTEKMDVIGNNAHPFFIWAKESYGKSAIPKWNFHKIIVGKDGRIAETFSSITNPSSKKFRKVIEKNLENETLKGVMLIKNKLFDSLKSKGLSLVDVKKGDEFNADDHEAVTQIPAPSKDMVGKIIDIIEKGYKLGEKVIRYPKVVIGK